MGGIGLMGGKLNQNTCVENIDKRAAVPAVELKKREYKELTRLWDSKFYKGQRLASQPGSAMFGEMGCESEKAGRMRKGG